MFNARERRPRRPPAWFKWDENRKFNTLTIADEGMSIASNNLNNYQPALGETEMKSGVWEWEMKLESFYADMYSVMVGVAPAATQATQNHMFGYSGHLPGWTISLYGGIKYANGQQANFGPTYQQGDVVGFKLDLDKKTLETFRNGVSSGVAHTGINGPVRPCISLYGVSKLKLAFPK